MFKYAFLTEKERVFGILTKKGPEALLPAVTLVGVNKLAFYSVSSPSFRQYVSFFIKMGI